MAPLGRPIELPDGAMESDLAGEGLNDEVSIFVFLYTRRVDYAVKKKYCAG